jgi:hypothetical protein
MTINRSDTQANGARRKPEESVLIPPPTIYTREIDSNNHWRSLNLVNDRGRGWPPVAGHPHWSQKYGGLSWIANTGWSNLKFALQRLHENMRTAK